MEYKILKAIFHNHDLSEQKLVLSDKEIEIKDSNIKEQYLINLLKQNSKKNAGKLANFSLVDDKNLFQSLCNLIINDNEKFVTNTKRIMKELVEKKTPKTSSSGNYLFVLFKIEDNENSINNDGEIVNNDINEVRLAMLKFELRDSRYIKDCIDSQGKSYLDIIIDPEKGLPAEQENVKKAAFINNAVFNKLNYQLKVIDRETSDHALFFTNNILGCKYTIRSQRYVPKFKTITYEYIDKLITENVIDKKNDISLRQKFESLIRVDSTIDQTKIGNYLFEDLIEDENILTQVGNDLLNLYHEKGLIINKFTVSEKDVVNYYTKQRLKISNDSYLKFSQADEETGIIEINNKLDKESKKYLVKIYLDEAPIKLITNEK